MSPRPSEPRPPSYFDVERAAVGSRAMTLVLGDLAIELRGVDSPLERRLAGRYGPYLGPADRPALCVDVAHETGFDYFIEPRPGESNPLLLACDGPRVRTTGYCSAGWFDTRGGCGQLVLSDGRHETRERSIENYLRAATAWVAAERGGALIHAASSVLDERGYLFYGESGAGKSTLSAHNRRARVVSDDLSLVLPGEDGGPWLVGTPFRGTYEEGEPFLGRARLVAGFRIVKDAHAEVRAVPRVRAFAELVGNLPFVAEAFSRRPDLFERVDRAFRDVPLAHLHFRKDDDYWDAIAAAGL
ncbi:MAG TPA: hypothetical protein VD788_16180 [Candidatus Polarisedimenticolaceae bacterium]|nr:hypothetical protein [Candidatus Polarisedimenticolaceae bacterium]